MQGNAESVAEWADPDDLVFVLRDGSVGNPGCDECGTEDAVLRIDGTYLCATAAREHGLKRPQHNDGGDAESH